MNDLVGNLQAVLKNGVKGGAELVEENTSGRKMLVEIGETFRVSSSSLKR